MDAIGTAVARAIGPRLDASEHCVGWIFRALRAAHRRAGHEGAVPHAPRGTVPNRDPGIVRINSYPVWEQAAVHHLMQYTVARILVDGTRPVAHVGARSGGPGIGEEQVSVGVEIEVVGAFKQLVAPSI